MHICPVSLDQRHGHRGILRLKRTFNSSPHFTNEEMGANRLKDLSNSYKGTQNQGWYTLPMLSASLLTCRQGMCFF